MTKVYSLPSEKVPAHHSPNCTFEFKSNSPVVKNLCTSTTLLFTSLHLSNIIGFIHANAKCKAQKRPLGPVPMTTGLFFNLVLSICFIS
ncbi:MAG: hypothetical protein Q8S84_06720 [bacterium]|nr:hypothetical protein [bacterium]MDP3381152.1 hypothetical protein [bacterium]